MMGPKTLAEIRAELRSLLQSAPGDPIARAKARLTEGGKKPLSQGSKDILDSFDRLMRETEKLKPKRKRSKSA